MVYKWNTCFSLKKPLFPKEIMNIYSPKQLIFCSVLLSIVCTNTTFAHIAQDLELDKIFTSIDRTHTAQGKKALRELLATPTSDVKVLRDRQSVIAYLVNHSTKHKQIIAALKQVSKHEQVFAHAFAQNSSVENASLEQFYFSSDMFKSWNETPIGLDLGQIAHFANLMSSPVQHCLAFLLFKETCGHNHSKEKKQKHEHNDTKEHAHCSKKDKKKHDHKHDNIIEKLRQPFLFWHTGSFFQELYSTYTTTCNELRVIKELQQQLMTVAHGMRAINAIHALLHDQSEITTHVRLHKNLDAICMQVDISEKLTTLLELLETRTFKGKPSVFSRTGNILAAYKLLQEVAHELQPALDAIGEIDACSSCAQLMTEHKTHDCCYSLAQYVTDQPTPHIQSYNVWHPLIDTTEVTMNNFNLGIDTFPRNALLTGPNACGKSTNLKSITLCVYLAQTLGIVPAEQHCQTVFKEIYSSMVVADQLQQGKSLFITELENAHALLQRVDTLAPGECIFVALDELFKSTQHEKGQNVAYQLLKKLHACQQVITVASTHFEELTQLARKNPALCTNYTVENFKIVRGIGAFDDMGDENYFD